jgi:hypothetical protein
MYTEYWKSIGFQILLRTKYVPSLVKIHWRMLIRECSQGCYMVKYLLSDLNLWPMTLKIKMVPDWHVMLLIFAVIWSFKNKWLIFVCIYFLSPRQRNCEGI